MASIQSLFLPSQTVPTKFIGERNYEVITKKISCYQYCIDINGSVPDSIS